MTIGKREQVRSILLSHGFRREDFDEAFWSDKIVEGFLKDPEEGVRWFKKQAMLVRREMDNTV